VQIKYLTFSVFDGLKYLVKIKCMYVVNMPSRISWSDKYIKLKEFELNQVQNNMRLLNISNPRYHGSNKHARFKELELGSQPSLRQCG